MKPFLLNHKIGTGAGVFMKGYFRYITKHLYFTPKAVNSSVDEGKSPDISAAYTQQKAAETIVYDVQTDNPFWEFEAIHAARIASAPPPPWTKRIDDKPKIIVVEEMDLNDISEIFLCGCA